MRIPRFIAVALLTLACGLGPAHAEKRVALVIGNDRYVNLSASDQLQKAVNDARAVRSALQQIGFDVVSGENLGRQALIDLLDDAARRASPGDMVFFFFSGHGIAVDGANYILPADMPVVVAGQINRLTSAAIREDDIAAAFLRAGVRVAIVVLDACRNNPFASSGTKGVGGDKGLAPHEPPSGVFTLYAASRGQAALDRLYDGDRNPNSVFTRVLLPALARTDLDLPGLAVEVRDEVMRLARSINYDQRPSYYDETSGGRIFLAAAGKGPAVIASAPAPAGQQQMAVIAPPVASTMNVANEWSGIVQNPGAVGGDTKQLELKYVRTQGGFEGTFSLAIPGYRDRYVVHKFAGSTPNAEVEFNMIQLGQPPGGRNTFWCEHGVVRITELADGKVYVKGKGNCGSGFTGGPGFWGTLNRK